MFLFNLMGIVLTLITLALLGLAGYLSAVRLLGDEAERDPLALAIAALLAATAEALGIGLLLGACGLLRLDLALGILLLLVLVLLRAGGRAAPGELEAPARRLAARAWARLAEHPALSLLAAHAVGSEALRGLVRPPLSWDSLMYHLMLAATWLQDGNLKPVFGSYPVNDYGFVPANGSIWLWWWMAPSHSELYANLAALGHWALLALATGGIARALGARRHWPLAAFVVAVTPTVVRFAATQYVDIFLASALLAAAFFGLRWLQVPSQAREPRWADALLAGAGLGIVCGAKLLGVPYAMALAAAVVLAARGAWRRRLPQLAAALLACAALGSFFYLRNIAYGAGPLAIVCEGRTGPPPAHPLPALPRPSSVVDIWQTVGHGQVLDAFLGITRPQSLELGVGPESFLLAAALLALPFGLVRARRRAGLVMASQALFELAFWLVVPFAANLNIFANVRYLIPAVGIALAGGVAMAEERGMSDAWLSGLALVLALQGMLQLHAEMPHEVRVTLGVIDLGLAALALSPALRGFARRRARALAAAALAAAVLGAPVPRPLPGGRPRPRPARRVDRPLDVGEALRPRLGVARPLRPRRIGRRRLGARHLLRLSGDGALPAAQGALRQRQPREPGRRRPLSVVQPARRPVA